MPGAAGLAGEGVAAAGDVRVFEGAVRCRLWALNRAVDGGSTGGRTGIRAGSETGVEGGGEDRGEVAAGRITRG